MDSAVNKEKRKPSLCGLADAKPRTITVDAAALVCRSFLDDDRRFPLIVTPASGRGDLISWAQHNRERIQTELLDSGAILFRGFDITAPPDFERFITVVSGEMLEYRERSSPRERVLGNIYTSTNYPQDYAIFPHNENSYASVWPMNIFFYCETAPSDGGETPIVDARRVYSRIPPHIREKFEQQNVMYVRNFSGALGLDWQTVFQTADRLTVDVYCRESGYETQWGEGDHLRTRRIGQAVAIHPVTGDKLWFNHAVFFHLSTLEPSIRDGLSAHIPEDLLPHHSLYGNGSPIEPDVLAQVRDAYIQEMVYFKWERGDVLMLDNMLTAHGRASYKGERRILVGMSRPFHGQALLRSVSE